MLKFHELSLRRGTKLLLNEVSCALHAGQRVGITGANGAGKSSVFALIRNQLHPDHGDLSLPPNTVISHVAQETPALAVSALDYVLDGDTELRAIEKKIAEAESANNGEKLALAYDQMANIDGYTAPSRASRLLSGLGFSTEQESLSVKSFSGGWRMRLNLAQALMCRSDLLLLDEPTNHLDLEAVIWLEEWLLTYQGMLLLISHDRDFLDRVVTHIGHIEQQDLTIYTGDYSDFEKTRAAKLAGQQAAYEKQQREIKHMQSFVDRFKAKASKAKQAQSRVKALERMEVISQAHVDSQFSFEFFEPEKQPDPLLTIEKANVGYGDVEILSEITARVSNGDRVGLLGHNGAGKSTFIKLLAGELSAQKGSCTFAKDVKVGYFAQHQLEQLVSDDSPLNHLQRLDPKASEQSLRNFLGGFAFQGDMVTDPVKPLSGGEKARLVLAMIVYEKPNLLLLDEPTNHLDLEMRFALTRALQSFVGAMVVVSHDRHLLRTVTDTLLLVDSGKVNEFSGDLDDYRQWVRNSQLEAARDSKEACVGTEQVSTKKELRQSAAEKRKLQQPLRNKVKKLDKELASLTEEQDSINAELAEETIYNEENKEKLISLLAKQKDISAKLEAVEEAWMLASEELEQIENE